MRFQKGQSGNPKGNYPSLMTYWLRNPGRRRRKRLGKRKRSNQQAMMKIKGLAEQIGVLAGSLSSCSASSGGGLLEGKGVFGESGLQARSQLISSAP
jgi:hypothetical protein